MLIFIILLPLFSFLSGTFFGRFLGWFNVGYLTFYCIFITFYFSLCIFFNDILMYELISKVILGNWIVVSNLNVKWSFCFDSLTFVMLLVVTCISCLVHLYSTSYMKHDPHFARFMSYLSLFTFFMLILITANNFLQMFVGWEGVGLSSYLLINFWFTRIQANKAAIKAMLVNRVGDFFILLGIFTIYCVFNSLDYDIVFSLVPLIVSDKLILGSFEISAIDTICILLFFGAMGKSAQLGLHTWLPDAMEGPTPVSALIHAATMVTAGVFLIARCSILFEYSPFALNLVVLIGSMTCFFSATTGLFQNDVKKVIAYSTCSQLGYMIFACGLSSYDVSIFHLSNHAFFKALLFLSAGSIIHSLSDEQDLRRMGGLRSLLPFSYAAILIGSLALTGFPFLAGFYSKDAILEVAFSKGTAFGYGAYFLGVSTAFCTSFYSVRLLILVFLSEVNANKIIIKNAHESDDEIMIPMFILSFLSILIGFLTKDILIGVGTPFWGSSIFILPQNYSTIEIEFIPFFFKILPLVASISGGLLAYLIYIFELSFFYNFENIYIFQNIFNFLIKKWYFDRLYNEIFCQKLMKFGHNYIYKDVDRGLIELLGPSGIVDFTIFNYNLIKKLQSGVIYHYLFLSFFGVFFIIFIFTIISFIYKFDDLLIFILCLYLYFNNDF